MSSDLAHAWRTNAAITLELLEALPAKALAARYSPRTRSVAAQFAHIHYVRVQNLEKRGGPGLAGRAQAFERGAEPGKRALVGALEASGTAMAELFEAVEESGRVKSWKEPPATYLGYHCAHEAHHRGLVLVSLRLAGIEVPELARYDLWYRWRKPR